MPVTLTPGAEPVPGYRLVRLLGQGGFGQVWEAEAPGRMRVALKFIRVDSGHSVPELRAIEAIRDVRHPHLLDIHFCLNIEDHLVIATSLCDKSLLDRFKEFLAQGEQGIPLDPLLRYMEETAVAIDFLNEHGHTDESGRKVGIQHRDIKPHNIFLVGDSVKVADFGLAKALDQSVASHTGAMTPYYAPPEMFQYAVAKTSDQYSLAVSYYQLRTGRFPFSGGAMRMMYAHLHEPPNLEALPAEEQPIVVRALAKDPMERWPSCGAFVSALKQAVTMEVSQWPDGSTRSWNAVSEDRRGDSNERRRKHSDPTKPRPVERTDDTSPTSQEKEPTRLNLSQESSTPSVHRAGGKTGVMAVTLCLLAVATAVVVYIATDYGTIRIALQDPAAVKQVKIDAAVVAVASLEKPIRLRAGVHDLEATGDGHETLALSFTVQRGDNPVLEVEFAPTQTPADVANSAADQSGKTPASLPAVYRVTVSPTSALLSAQGLPAQISETAAGRRVTISHPDESTVVTFTATLRGYESAVKRLVPKRGADEEMTLTLTPKPAVMTLTLDPPDMELQAFPSKVQMTGSGGRRQVIVARPDQVGTVEFLVSSPGYVATRYPWSPKPGERVGRTLRPKPDLGPFAGTRVGEERELAPSIVFCWCPPGTFTMGSPNDEPGRENDEAQVEVTLNGFWMGKFEVTQEQWINLMGTTLSEQHKSAHAAGPLRGEGDRFPMYFVNHDEASAFCTKLTEQERQAERLPANWEYRLPTEAQWEYACRAGSTTATAFGDSLSSRQANFHGGHPYNSASKGPKLEKTCVVGGYPPNAWGLHDMHGNVWEWCQDWYTESLAGRRNRELNVRGNAPIRVLRGGCWGGYGWYCRSANRDGNDPSYRYGNIGFRVACVRSGGAE